MLLTLPLPRQSLSPFCPTTLLLVIKSQPLVIKSEPLGSAYFVCNALYNLTSSSQYYEAHTATLHIWQFGIWGPAGLSALPKSLYLVTGRTGIGNQLGWRRHLCEVGSRVWEHLAQCLARNRCSVSQVHLNWYCGALYYNICYNSISSMGGPMSSFYP